MFNPFKPRKRVSNTHISYTPGPVFTEPAMAAIYNSDLAKPAQRILGGGYPIQKQMSILQPLQLFTPKALTPAGIGIQQGQYAVASLTDVDGSWTQSVDGTGVYE